MQKLKKKKPGEIKQTLIFYMWLLENYVMLSIYYCFIYVIFLYNTFKFITTKSINWSAKQATATIFAWLLIDV